MGWMVTMEDKLFFEDHENADWVTRKELEELLDFLATCTLAEVRLIKKYVLEIRGINSQ